MEQAALATRGEFRVVQVRIWDVRRIHRLEKAIFPRDAYSVFTLALLFLLPNVHNFNLTAPGDKLAGFVSLSHALDKRVGWVVTIGIAPEFQRQGLGSFLLAWSEDWVDVPHLRLTVRVSNTPAINLYEKAGYDHVRRSRNYYGDEDGFVMEKQLKK